MSMRTKVRMVSFVTTPGPRGTCLKQSEAAGTAGRTVVKEGKGVRG